MKNLSYSLQPEDVLLLGVVRGDLGGGAGDVDGGLALVGGAGGGLVGLLVLVEPDLAVLKDHADTIPRPDGRKKRKIRPVF